MRNKWTKRIFPFIALLLLAPWPIAYGHDAGDGVVEEETVQIEAAEASAQPAWTAFGKAIGGVDTPGDVFYIDATDNPGDIQVTLHITNAKELSHCYRYLILNVGIYVKSDAGEWKKAAQYNGEPIPDTFITMSNGQVGFSLPGLAKYKITIDSGSFYCINAVADGGSVSPQLYLEVD